MCTEKNVHSAVTEWRILLMSVRSSCLMILFKSSVSLLIFYVVILSSIESGVLKSPTMIGELSVC